MADFNLDELAENLRKQSGRPLKFDPTTHIDYLEPHWCPDEMRIITSQTVGPDEERKKVIPIRDL